MQKARSMTTKPQLCMVETTLLRKSLQVRRERKRKRNEEDKYDEEGQRKRKNRKGPGCKSQTSFTGHVSTHFSHSTSIHGAVRAVHQCVYPKDSQGQVILC